MNEIPSYIPENQIPPSVPENENKELLRIKFQSTLVGGAIGDTLGMPVEGWDREQIRRYVGFISEPIDPVVITDSSGDVVHRDEIGRIPYISPYLQKGQITDDTWLSITTARSIVTTGSLDLEDLAQQSVALFEQQMEHQKEITPTGTPIAAFLHPESEIPQPFGGTTIAAFENLQKGKSPTESGVLSRNPGNAPAIKMAPLGMYMYATDRYDEGLSFAEKAGQMTHLDPRSIVSGIVQAHAVYSLLHNVDRDDFLTSITQVCKEWEKSSEHGKKVTLLQRLQWVVDNKDIDEEEAYQHIGVGWPVTKNYPFTLYMFQKYWDNPQEGLLHVVNSGGDCDSTAAIFGALAGAKNGIFYPEAGTISLEAHTEMNELAHHISSLSKT